MAPLANPLKRKPSGRPSKAAPSPPASASGSTITSAGPGTPVEPEEHAAPQEEYPKEPVDTLPDAFLEQLRQTAAFNARLRSQVEADVQEGEAVEIAAAELDRRTARGNSSVSPKKSAKRSKTAKGQDVSTADQEAKMMGAELETVDAEDLNLRRLDLSLLADGVVLKPFQRTGVIWLAALDYQGAGGILGDEMGLGKTLQTIALLAHLRAKGLRNFNMIVVPKAVLTNWESEFKKFAPSLPILLYHGDKAQRKILRETRLGLVDSEQAPFRRLQRSELQRGKTLNGNEEQGLRLSPIPSKIPADDKPILITTYEFAVRDRPFLETLRCGILVLDEGQRLKNKDSKTVRELSQYLTDTRFLLTGTPLQNNLVELWSLLSFILPSTFHNLSGFMNVFESVDKAAGSTLKDKLHALLQPWMLRRLKTDVELNLPPKKEYLLSVPLTAAQKELYASIVNKNLRGFLLTDKQAPLPIDGPAPSKRRKSTRSFKEETDDEFFANAEAASERPSMDAESVAEIGRAHQQKMKVAAINNQHLQNAVIQMRKAANHPLLFHTDIDSILPADVQAELGASGKMILLERLLVPLLKKRHKVLIFSQFVTMLDIVHKWCDEIKGWPVCLIKGDVDLEERREQIEAFDDLSPESPHIFLLSTRAGGVGINLCAADTVIFFDSDWNPQQDLQALARAHRIGQTKPVVAYRMVSNNTIEEKILERAAGKRKLEALVLGHDKFAGRFADFKEIKGGSKKKGPSLADELAEELAQEANQDFATFEKGDVVFTDKQLLALLDRSDAAMKSTAAIGGTSKFSAKVTVTKTFGEEDEDAGLEALFEVDERPEDIELE